MSTVEPIAADRLGHDSLGRPLNPDTDLPYPGASAPQEQLADELLARLVDTPDLWTAPLSTARDLIRDALIEVAVRQHGRTLRDVRAELNGQATAFEADARTLAQDALALALADAFTLDRAASIERLTIAARALRNVVLGAWRS